jgi:hypothetical protein
MSCKEEPVNHLILQRFLRLAHEVMPKLGGIWTVNELCIVAQRDERPIEESLYGSLLDICWGCNGQISNSVIGTWLGRNRGQVWGRLSVERAGTIGGATGWTIKRHYTLRPPRPEALASDGADNTGA